MKRNMSVLVLLLCCMQGYLAATPTYTDESALLAFKSQITFDPFEILSKNWTQETDICNWIGISCSKRHHERVTALVLRSFGFRGSVAKEIGNLSFLRILDIGNNSFHGKIPYEIGRLSRIKYLSLQMNNLTGEIPAISIGLLNKIEVLDISDNDLHGHVTFNVSPSLLIMDFRQNRLTGNLPTEFCTSVPNLQGLSLSNNQLVGQIPSGLNKCTQLLYLSLSFNQFTGNLPRDMWNLTKLQDLFLAGNNLTGNIPNEIENLSAIRRLSLRRNELVGTLPPSLGNLSTLVMIDFGENKIHGNIPTEVGYLSSLEQVYLGSNMLSGEVAAASIFNISSLKVISLAANGLSGNLPSNLAYSLPNLEGLYTLPSSISNATNLKFLDIGRNMFSGIVPNDVGRNLEHLISINLQRNQLTNEPSSTGELSFLISLSHCKFLNNLYIGDNQFRGTLDPKSLTNFSVSLERFIAFSSGIRGKIPVEIGNLTNLSWLTLGDNELIGSIPQELGNLNKLQTLRMYYNKLDGSIPESLCNIKGLYYLDLTRNQLSGQVLGCLGNISSLRNIYLDSNALSSSIPLNFWSNKDISIVSLSSILLNGSLALEIGNVRGLSELYLSGNELFGQIPSTIDVASALEYLHQGHSLVVVHCDLKPSNILLDGDMVARVSDFGISKLLTMHDPVALTKTLGTIGYMAPEYGSEGIVSTMGDVYSYGILLMETFTRTKPVDDEFVGELNLKRWIAESYPHRVMEIVDANLFSRDDQHWIAIETCLRSVLELALECTVDLPQDRITMNNVFVRLNNIQTLFLHNVSRN